MDRRVAKLKENKRQLKNEIKHNDKKLYKLFVGFLIFGILNWLFWYNQYLNKGILCDAIFVYLPILLGMIFFHFKFSSFQPSQKEEISFVHQRRFLGYKKDYKL